MNDIPNFQKITKDDIARVARHFQKKKTPRDKRKVTIREGYNTHRLTPEQLDNYVERKR